MKKIIVSPLLLATLLFGTACESNKTKDPTEVAEETNEKKFDDRKAEDDSEFLVDAASGGLFEVELGNLAVKNASSPKVKEFGQTMAMDHSKANEELKTLASKKNVTIPTAPGEDYQKKINELSQKKGAEFDKAYMKTMVDDHEDDIEEFQEAFNKGNDVEIKAFAQGKVPILQHHLEMARAIYETIK